MSSFILIIINIFLAVAGQTAIKQGVAKIGSFSDMPLRLFIQKSLCSPLVASGVLLYVFSSFIWFMVLSKVELSIAYPTLSLGYVLIFISSYFFLHEPVTFAKIAGAVLICTGTFLIFRR